MTMTINGVALAVIVCYYLVVNIIMFIMMAIDKKAAIKDKWRVAEKHFYILAVLGAGLGGLVGMVTQHHKSRHMDFIFIFTVTAVLHFIVLYFLIGKFAITFA